MPLSTLVAFPVFMWCSGVVVVVVVVVVQPLNLFRNNVILSDRMTGSQVELAIVGHEIACIYNLISDICIFICISCKVKVSYFNQGPWF